MLQFYRVFVALMKDQTLEATVLAGGSDPVEWTDQDALVKSYAGRVEEWFIVQLPANDGRSACRAAIREVRRNA